MGRDREAPCLRICINPDDTVGFLLRDSFTSHLDDDILNFELMRCRFRWWDSGNWAIAIIICNFWESGERVNIFCMWERSKLRVDCNRSNSQTSPRPELPGVHALYNLFLLNVDWTLDSDGKSFPKLGSITWKRWRDFADGIKALFSLLWVYLKMIILGRLGQINWACKIGSRSQCLSFMLSLKNETAITSTASKIKQLITLINIWDWENNPNLR